MTKPEDLPEQLASLARDKKDLETFLESLKSLHRTHQQSIGYLIKTLIEHFHNMQEKHQTDLRNEQTCKVCSKAWKENFQDECFPFI